MVRDSGVCTGKLQWKLVKPRSLSILQTRTTNEITPSQDMNGSAADKDLPIEVDVHQAVAILNENPEACLLDVREPAEIQASRLENTINIPMMQLPFMLHVLPRDKPILVLCHHGARSLRAAGFLRSSGMISAQSIRGGIDAWSLEIDPTVPRY